MWPIIIAFILRLIAEGIDPSEAVNAYFITIFFY